MKIMLPQNFYYTKDHEWAAIDGDVATVGITDYAQHSLGEITYIELPAAKKQLKAHDILAVVESSKAASDVYSPLAGAVFAINEELSSQPELVNTDCYNDGWICKIKISNPAAVKNLMTAVQYDEYLKKI
jgi:glycine cleavage system H protein